MSLAPPAASRAGPIIAPPITAASFAEQLQTRFHTTRKTGDGTASAGAWSDYVFPLLREIAGYHKLWWAGRGTGLPEPALGENREYLWDFTMYDRVEGRKPADVWSHPRVVVEHENCHGFDAFRFDHWKTLLSRAPLRVALGYRGRTGGEDRHEWVRLINEMSDHPANAWQFPPDTEDLIALGYDGMTKGTENFKFWLRSGAARHWTPL